MSVRNQDVYKSKSSPREFIRVLRLIAGRAFLFLAGLCFICLVLEAYFRLTVPFTTNDMPTRFVPNVGELRPTNTTVRWTNGLDFWTKTRSNSLGFLDREPIEAEQAASGCHIVLIGDSVVEAKEVPISEKLQVRLEVLAARHLPDMNITTSAFGVSGTGQVNQLALYDEYARHLRPKILVLVFVDNDFTNNYTLLSALHSGWDPDGIPWVTAVRDADGTIKLRPPHPPAGLVKPSPPPSSLWRRLGLSRISLLTAWLDNKERVSASRASLHQQRIGYAEQLRKRPDYKDALDGWQPTPGAWYYQPRLPPQTEAALDFTAFALDAFKQRADRDGVSLVILATHRMKLYGDRLFEWLNEMAVARDIPVIDQHDYLVRLGIEPRSVEWKHDPHWNAAGHQLAAEALLEYLEQHPEICEGHSVGE